MQETDPDAQLMLALRGGDGSAFDAIFHRWAAPLLRYLERMVRDVATSEELLQETFLRVYRARQSYVPRARFSTWLYRIATNLALNELRRPRRRREHASTEDRELRGALALASPASASDELVDARRLSRQLARELDRLPERQRMALWLSAVEGHSYTEVAAILEASEGSVKSLIHRARSTLVMKLGGLDGVAPGEET